MIDGKDEVAVVYFRAGEGDESRGEHPCKKDVIDSMSRADMMLTSIVSRVIGYTPTDYPSASDDEWKARILVERSAAVKCPTLGYQLAGTKKVKSLGVVVGGCSSSSSTSSVGAGIEPTT